MVEGKITTQEDQQVGYDSYLLLRISVVLSTHYLYAQHYNFIQSVLVFPLLCPIICVM